MQITIDSETFERVFEHRLAVLAGSGFDLSEATRFGKLAAPVRDVLIRSLAVASSDADAVVRGGRVEIVPRARTSWEW